jgi:hypothetical protein
MKRPTSKKYQYKVHQIALNCTADELRLFNSIKEHHQRKTDSDCLRFLIRQEAEKILGRKVHTRTSAGV